MGLRRGLGVLALCVCGTGCGLIGSAGDNLAFEAHVRLDRHREGARVAKLADHAWQQEAARWRGRPPEDYAQGFKDGFADYLVAGGTGQPPPVPPPCYWEARYRTPQGYRAIQEWYAGFAHGAEAARASGLRPFLTLPSAARFEAVPLPPPPPAEPPPDPGEPPAPPGPPPAEAPPGYGRPGPGRPAWAAFPWQGRPSPELP